MLASWIKWDHSVEWDVADFSGKTKSGQMSVEVDLSKPEDEYLAGHAIDGRVLFPATGYLTLVWKSFAKLQNTDYEQLPVIIENVRFLRATIMPKDSSVKFIINIFDGSGDFEICEGGSVAVTGTIRTPEDINKEQLTLAKPKVNTEHITLNSSDVYKDLRLRGYDYQGIFKGIMSADNYAKSGMLKWENNYISFIDTMLQFSIMGRDTRELYLPTRLQRCCINPEMHKEIVGALNEGEGVPVHMYQNVGIVKSGKWNFSCDFYRIFSTPKLVYGLMQNMGSIFLFL